MSQFNGGKAFKDKNHTGGQVMCTWHSHSTPTPSATAGPLFQGLLDSTSPGSPGSFPQAEAAPQPTPFLFHTVSLLQIIPDGLERGWALGQDKKQGGPDGMRLWAHILTEKETARETKAEGRRRWKCRRKGKQTKQSPLGGKEVKGKTQKSSLKGAAPCLSKSQLQSLPKIPHLKSFEPSSSRQRAFSFWRRALGLRAWALIFQGFLKTAQVKNSFWGLVSIYPTQNQPLSSQVLLMEGYYVHTQTSFSTHGWSVQRDYIKAVFPNQLRRTTHSPSTHIKKAFSLLKEKDTRAFSCPCEACVTPPGKQGKWSRTTPHQRRCWLHHHSLQSGIEVTWSKGFFPAVTLLKNPHLPRGGRNISNTALWVSRTLLGSITRGGLSYLHLSGRN